MSNGFLKGYLKSCYLISERGSAAATWKKAGVQIISAGARGIQRQVVDEKKDLIRTTCWLAWEEGKSSGMRTYGERLECLFFKC